MVKLRLVPPDDLGGDACDLHGGLHDEVGVDAHTGSLEELQKRLKAKGENLILVYLQDCNGDLQDPWDTFNNENIPDLGRQFRWESIRESIIY